MATSYVTEKVAFFVWKIPYRQIHFEGRQNMNLDQGDFFPEENLDEVRDKTRKGKGLTWMPIRIQLKSGEAKGV